MRIPTVILEGKEVQRVIFSAVSSTPHGSQQIFSLMRSIYWMDARCFDLPSATHRESFKELRHLTEDETLTGLSRLDAEEGVSFTGKPLHRFEAKIVSTLKKNVVPSNFVRNLLPSSASPEIFTQKEIDRILFDPSRFGKALSFFDPKESPFLLLGERYGDWLLGLGRIDLLRQMVSQAREQGFTPIYSGQWTTFVLPKAKTLDVAACAVPINQRWSPFDLGRACDLIKKCDKPVISLTPLADGEPPDSMDEAFSFLFNELKVLAAIVEVASEDQARKVIEVLSRFPSLISHRKT